MLRGRQRRHRARRPARGRSAARRTASRRDSPSPTRAARRYFVKFDPPGRARARDRRRGGRDAPVPRAWATTCRRRSIGTSAPRVPRDRRRTPPSGCRTGTVAPCGPSDIDEQLRRAQRNPDGSYRVILGEALEGTPLEGFMYEGTRPDDPNDIVPHENRRELRGLRVFSAWVNHTDAKAINSLDTLVDGGRPSGRAASPASTSTRRSEAPASACANGATATSIWRSSGRRRRRCRRSASTSGRG